MKKYLVFVASTFALAGAGLGTGTLATANAQSSHSVANLRPGQRPVRNDRRQGGSEHLELKLNQAVKNGTITIEQKTAFLNEVKMLRAGEQNRLRNAADKAERQSARQAFHDALKIWAQSHHFPLEKIFYSLPTSEISYRKPGT